MFTRKELFAPIAALALSATACASLPSPAANSPTQNDDASEAGDPQHEILHATKSDLLKALKTNAEGLQPNGEQVQCATTTLWPIVAIDVLESRITGKSQSAIIETPSRRRTGVTWFYTTEEGEAYFPFSLSTVCMRGKKAVL